MERIKRVKPAREEGSKTPLPPPDGLVRTGSTLLDLVVGGGWALGRIANIVGDKSTGKTLLAIEACANFAKDYPKGKIWYRETEAAFDKSYAEALGMPVRKVKFKKLRTVEDVFDDMRLKAEWLVANNREGIYILDSLDAISDRKELDRRIDENSYGGDKAKQMSQLFRRLVATVEKAKMLVIIISQVRDKIGISFGRKTTRSGGKALDFYASQVVYLSHIKTLSKTIHGTKRAIGVLIKAKCDKNKVGLPFRECTFPIRFSFGVEDLQACVLWLKSIGKLPLDRALAKKILNSPDDLSNREYDDAITRVRDKAIKEWNEIENQLKPVRKKYE